MDLWVSQQDQLVKRRGEISPCCGNDGKHKMNITPHHYKHEVKVSFCCASIHLLLRSENTGGAFVMVRLWLQVFFLYVTVNQVCQEQSWRPRQGSKHGSQNLEVMGFISLCERQELKWNPGSAIKGCHEDQKISRLHHCAFHLS